MTLCEVSTATADDGIPAAASYAAGDVLGRDGDGAAVGERGRRHVDWVGDVPMLSRVVLVGSMSRWWACAAGPG